MFQGEVCRMFELDGMACGEGADVLRPDGDYLLITAKGDLDQLRKVVPAPLEASEDVSIYMGSFYRTVRDGVTTWAYPFHEWGVGVSARLTVPPYEEGLFLVQCYVDDDFALVGGREQWGYPKKMGQFAVEPPAAEDSSSYEYRVTRRGTQVASGRIENLTPISVDDFPAHGVSSAICYRQIPAPDRVSVEKRELVFIQYNNVATDTKQGVGSIAINDGPFDQIPIGPLTVTNAYFGRLQLNCQLAHLIVPAEEDARPLDLSRAGESFDHKDALISG